MDKYQKAIEKLLEQKLLPLYYHEEADEAIALLRALHAGGVRVVEFTDRGPSALENFRKMKEVSRNLDGMLLGIGTIKTAGRAKEFIEAGADFIVCPSVNPEVGRLVRSSGLLWIPGCLTPTEIALAEEEGAELVKIFPGNLLGPDYITAIRDLFPKIKFMPTGGVEAEAENLKSWFSAGVVAVGMGSKLLTRQILEEKNYQALENATREALQLVSEQSNRK